MTYKKVKYVEKVRHVLHVGLVILTMFVIS